MAEMIFTKDNFETEVLKSDKPVLVDFFATWCGPCQMMAPIIEEVANENADTLKVGKLDVDKAPELAQKYGIISIPAILLFKNGEVVKSQVGYTEKAKLQEMFKGDL